MPTERALPHAGDMHLHRFADRPRTSLAVFAAAAALGGWTLIATGPAVAATPKKGAACTKAQRGKVSATLVCAKVGTKYRWQTAAVPAVGATTPAAATPSVSSIGADVLSTAIDGSVNVTQHASNVTGKTYNTDGRCSVEALLTAFVGCGGTGTLSGSATPYTWRVIGQAGSEYQIYTKKLPTATTIGVESWWVQPFPDALHVIWLPRQPEPSLPIRAFYLQFLTTDRSPLIADPALIERLVRTAGIIDAAVANRAK